MEVADALPHPSSSWIFCQFISKFLIHPSFFCFLLSQSHCCLRFLLLPAPQPPSPSVFTSTPFLSSKVLYLVSLTRSGKEPVELIGRRKKSRGMLQPSFTSFYHQHWTLQMKQGALTVTHHRRAGRSGTRQGHVLFVLKYWGFLTSLYAILKYNVFWNGGDKAYC